MRSLLCFAVLPLVLTSLACAQNPTREYDVRHLIIDVPDFSDKPVWDLKVASSRQSATRPAGGLFGAPSSRQDNDRDAIVANLVRTALVICNGATGVKVDELNGRLVVTAPADRHDRIKAAFDLATLARATQVNIASHIIVLPTDQIARFDPALRANIDHTLLSREPVLLANDQSLQLLKAVQPTANSAPRVTLFNGQRAAVLVSVQQTYVVDYQPATGKTVQFDPVTDVLESGMLLDVRVSAAGDVVSLNLRAQVAQLLEMKETPWPGAPGSGLKVQKPVQRVLENDRLTTLKSGQWLLMSLPATDPVLADPKTNCFVLVQPTVIVQKESDPNQPSLIRDLR